ncbi:O-methyltransferase [Planctomycetota bacterium]
MDKIATTGKNRRWGTVLYLLARSFRSTTVLEFGSCAGISACYLSSAPSVNKLITVEGSKDLAIIAEDSLARFAGKSKVVNSLFDDAIDNELPMLEGKIDYVYIDGHHEKIATIHYFDKLLPYLMENALVVFDDISWSYDMREAWDILRKREEFSHAMDLGVIGVCILKDNIRKKTAPENWNLQPIVGKRRIHTPDRKK